MSEKEGDKSTNSNSAEINLESAATHEDSSVRFARRSLLAWALPAGVAIGIGSIARPAQADLVNVHGDSYPHQDHTDGAHFDNTHMDEPHEDTFDAPSHFDEHLDAGAHIDYPYHVDDHSDGHVDFSDVNNTRHIDVPHDDENLTDHTDFSHDDITTHEDHNDVHNDNHGDIPHYDDPHVDHTDGLISHIDIPGDHTDGYNHYDGHVDVVLFDDDNVDRHDDSPHEDSQHYDHIDQSHLDDS